MGIEDVRALGIPGLLNIAPIGGSETLYRTRQLSKDREVALRFLDYDLGADDGPLRGDCVVRALRILSQHPHIVTVYSSGHVADGRMYLLLELLEEGSLGEWVAADGRLPCAEVLQVAVKIGGALETAHRAGIAHGRLRPESILVSPSGEPQLAGLDEAAWWHVHARGDGAAMPSIDDDITALASAMFTLLTAAHPAAERMEALERCQVPAPVRGLIERCLADDHAFRPHSIQDLTAAIQQVQQVLGMAVTDAVVDERAAEQAGEALRQVTASPLAESEPESEPVEAEPEPLETGSEAEDEVAEPEPEAEPETEPSLEGPEPQAEPSPAVTSRDAEEEPEEEPSAPEQWPTLRPPARLSRRRWRRIVTVAVLALLGTAVALVSTLLIRRTPAPPAAADQSSPPVVMEQPASNRDVVYTGFRTIADESGQLSMIVPEEWSQVRSSPWVLDGKSVGNQLEAALDSPAEERWSRPFAVLATSQTLGTTHTVDQVLDQLRISPSECTYTGRTPFNDNIYEGAVDSYAGCGQPGAKTEILVATSKEPAHLVMVQVARLGPRDENARDRVMETFHVSG